MSHEPMNETQLAAMWDTLREVARERLRQHMTHGEQDLPNDIRPEDEPFWDNLLWVCRMEQVGDDKAPCKAPWSYVLTEEVCEAVLERDPVKLRTELLQVAAVAAQWVEALDRQEGVSLASLRTKRATDEGMGGAGEIVAPEASQALGRDGHVRRS